MRRFLLAGALIGLLLPAPFLVAAEWGNYIFGGVVVAVWPTSIWLMALDHQSSFKFIATVYAMSIGANVVLYAVLSFLAFCI